MKLLFEGIALHLACFVGLHEQVLLFEVTCELGNSIGNSNAACCGKHHNGTA